MSGWTPSVGVQTARRIIENKDSNRRVGRHLSLNINQSAKSMEVDKDETTPRSSSFRIGHSTSRTNSLTKMAIPTYTNQPSLDLELANSSNKENIKDLNGTNMETRPLIHLHPIDEEKKEAPKSFGFAASLKEVSAVLLYSFCSISMILVNKSLASSYNHLIEKKSNGKADLNTLLVVIQAAAAVVFLWVCKLLRWVEFPPLKWSVAVSWAPVNVFFCLMIFTGMVSLQTNSVPMVTVFKNVANITTAIADYFFFGNQLNSLSIAAFAIMLMGAIAASWNDLSTSLLGLFWMIFNCLATTGYVCYMRYATQSIKLTKFGMVYVNNILCVFFLVPVAFLNGEMALFLKSTALHTWDYAFKNLFAGFVGFFLNFASLNCVSVTGPTTYAIVGSLNKVPVTFLGCFLFKDKLSKETWLFVGVSLLGGFLYTYAMIQTKVQEKKQVEANPDSSSRK